MKDNFDLKEFLVKNKTIENSNMYLKENQYEKDAEADDAEHIDALEKDMVDDKKDSLRKKVREMIINELSEEMDPELDYEGASEEEMYGDYKNDDESYYQHSHQTDIELEEAKEEEIETDKSEDTEEVESEETEETEDGASEEEKSETGGGIEDIAADMEGSEGDLMDHLISALKVSKSMDNEKLTTQIGNTLKFFVGEYIGGEE